MRTTPAPARTPRPGTGPREPSDPTRRPGFGTAHLVRRQLTSAPGALALIAATVLLVCALVTAWPRAVDGLLADHLAAEVSTLSAVRAEPSAVTPGWMPWTFMEGATGAEALAEALAEESRALADERDREAGAALRPALGDVTVVVEGPRTPVDKGPRSDHITQMTLVTRVDADLADRVDVVEGALPGAVDQAALDAALALGDNRRTLAENAPPLEAALSVESAARMGWAVGETRPLAGPYPWPFELVGTFEARDPADGYWSHLESTLAPTVIEDGDLGTFVHGTAYLDPSALWSMTMIDVLYRHHWYAVDRRAVAEAPTPQLTAELRGFEAATGTTSELTGTLAATLGEQRTLTTLLTVLAVGPVAAAVGVLWLAARLAVERRRAALELARARGASRRGLAFVVAIQGAVAALPAAAVGAALATLVVPGPVRPSAYVLPGLLGAVPAVLMALAAVRSGSASGAVDGRSRKRRHRRLVGEGAALVLAALAVVAVRARGLTGEGAGSDPVLLALPVLLTLAVGVVVLRAYPWPMRALARTLQRGRGLTGAVGAAVASRAPAPTASVLALVLAVAVTVFSGVTFSTVRAGIDETAVRTAGADLRLDLREPLPADDDAVAAVLDVLDDLDGVGAATAVHDAGRVTVDVGRSERTVAVLVVDAAALTDVHAGIDLSGRVEPLTSALTTADGVLPVLMSTALADLGTTVTLPLGDREVAVEAVATADAVPGVAAGSWWVVVDRERLERDADGTLPVLTTGHLLVDLTGADPADVRDAAASTSLDLAPTTPQAVAAGLRTAPLVAGMETGLGVVTAASGLLAVGVVVLTLALGTPGRDRRAALLSTLGAPRTGVRRLLLWEVAPLAVVAGLAGSAVGVLLPAVLLPMAELRPFTGGVLPPALTADPVLAVVVGVAATALAASATAIAGRRAGRTDPVRVLREGDRS